jgi:hypothetical protein
MSKSISTATSKDVVTSGCIASDVKGDCYENGGPHWMVRESSDFGAMEEIDKAKNYHPSAAMHLMRAEVLAFNYAFIVADAMFLVEKDLLKSSPSSLDKGKSSILILLFFINISITYSL